MREKKALLLLVWLGFSQAALAQTDETKTIEPAKEVVYLPAAGEGPLKEGVVFDVAVGEMLGIHVHSERPNAGDVKATVSSPAILSPKQFRQYVEFSPDGKRLLTGTGHWLLVIEAAKPGSGTIVVQSGTSTYRYRVQVSAAN